MRAEDFYFVKWRDIRWRHSSKMAAGGSGEDAFQTFYTEVSLKEQNTHYIHIHEQNRVNTHRWEAASHTHTNTHGLCVKPQSSLSRQHHHSQHPLINDDHEP